MLSCAAVPDFSWCCTRRKGCTTCVWSTSCAPFFMEKLRCCPGSDMRCCLTHMTARPERKDYVFILTVPGKLQIFQLFIVCRSAKNGGKQRVKNISFILWTVSSGTPVINWVKCRALDPTLGRNALFWDLPSLDLWKEEECFLHVKAVSGMEQMQGQFSETLLSCQIEQKM